MTFDVFDSEKDRDEFIAWYREKQDEDGFAFTAWDRERYAEALRQTLLGRRVTIDLAEYEGRVGEVVEVLEYMPVEPLVAVRLDEKTTVDVTAKRLKLAA